MSQPRAAGGKFGSQYKEKRGAAIALRLPISLDEAVRAAAGEELKAWIEDAIALKLKAIEGETDQQRPLNTSQTQPKASE